MKQVLIPSQLPYTMLMFWLKWPLTFMKLNCIKVLVVLVSFFLFESVFCQESAFRCFDSMSYVNNLDTLNLVYGNNKHVPNDLKLCFLIALSYYPEIANSKIRFKHTKGKYMLNSRPTALSLIFNRKSNRSYIIRTNNATRPHKVLIHHIDFNGKIGVLGHELGHIYDYSRVNGWE